MMGLRVSFDHGAIEQVMPLLLSGIYEGMLSETEAIDLALESIMRTLRIEEI